MGEIRIENLTFTYPNQTAPALKGVDLLIPESSFIVLLGKSGCGKSTLLRHLKKSLTPYGERSGEVFYKDISLDELDDRVATTDIGFVQQNPDSQLVTDKVWHELAFGLESLGLDNSVIRRRVAEMASYFGIQNWFRKDVSELSGGQKQLLNLASVMAMQPRVLVLDEPASQLDPISATEFLNTVYRINQELGTTVIISEHRLEEVFPKADFAVVMDEGEIIECGKPAEVGLGLAVKQDGEPHPMYHGMPSVMRAFPEEKLEKHMSLPLTLREGRLMLAELLNGVSYSKDSAEAGLSKENQKENQRDSAEVYPNVGKPALDLKDIYFRYEKNGNDILRGLNLSVRSEELYCLLGGNGSGKTTALKLITGIIKPQRGKVIFDINKKIALVPQNPQALFTEITAEDEVFEGMAYLDLTDEERIIRTEEMLSLMEIAHLRKQNPYDLSGGEQQRLALAKVLAYGPNLLLLDEPTKGLDPFFKRTLGSILKKLTERGVTIVMVSHDIEFCAEFGDRCAMFFDGEITSEGFAKEFFSGNNYYTTTANRLTRDWKGGLVLPEEVREWLKTVL